MKKLIGWTIFAAAWIFIGYGIFEFGAMNVLIPGLTASILGFIALGGIHLIRYTEQKEVSNAKK